MKELKSCPFCGESESVKLNTQAEIEELDTDDENFEAYSKYYTVCCEMNNGGCGASSRYGTDKKEVIANWNKRADEEITHQKAKKRKQIL